MKFCTAIFVIAMQVLAFGAGADSFILNNGDNTVTTNIAEIDRTVIGLNIAELPYIQSTAENSDTYSIALPEQFGLSRGNFLTENNILIPTITRKIAVPFDSDPVLTIKSSHYMDISGINLSGASEEDLASHVNDSRSIASSLQTEVALGEVAGEMRDIRIYTITFAPVQYDPENKVLRVYDNIEVEIDHSGTRLTRYDGQISEAFYPIYKGIFDNITVFDPIEVTRGAYWIIFPDGFSDLVHEFGEWKMEKGFHVEYIPKSAIGSNPPYTTIKNYIVARFDTCLVKPDYINIVADVTMPGGAGIVTKTYSNPYGFGDIESDNFYTFLFGNDYFPDILIGRISIDYASDLTSYKNKFFTYEKEPYMGDTGWYQRATVISGGDNGYFVSPRITKLWCRDIMLDAGYTRVDTFFESYYDPVYPSEINASINQGVAFVNYRGYGAPSGWSSPYYESSDLYQLTNSNRYPIMTSIVCGTGDFNDYTDVCFGEAWIRYSNKGGAGFIGNSNHDAHTAWTNSIDVGIYWGWFGVGVTSLAQGQLMGKMTLYDAFPTDRSPGGQVELYFNSYNILGDPELSRWAGIPKFMTVLYDDSAEVGENLVSVTVQDENGQPMPDAYVCLYETGQVFTGGFTSETGEIHFEMPSDVNGTVVLTATKRDYAPFQGTVTYVSNEVTVGYSSLIVDDDNSGESSGDGDGICNPSEVIELDLTLENYGSSQTSQGVTAQISSSDSHINIMRNSANFGDLAPGESGSGDVPYLISIQPDALDGSDVNLLVDITDSQDNNWQSIIHLHVESARIEVATTNIIDNGNGVIDPGETFEMTIIAGNNGTKPITGASAILRTSDDRVTIVDSSAVFGDCDPDGTFDNNDDTFIVMVDSDLFVGHLINFTLEFEGDGPMNVSAAFSQQVGIVQTDDPIGPDNYGYYCFDDTDTDYDWHPVYDWVDIDNQTWDYVTLGDDETATISLPFQVTYYGHYFDNITICDNGFVALGESWWNAWLNTPIPAPQNAKAMLSAFWDDFKQNNLRIYYHHDTENSRFIIGWRNVYDDDVYRYQTFEIILLDTEAWPTVTGDNEIIFQYEAIQNVYSTSVGICSPDRSDGIGYVFNNTYAAGAPTLQNGRALKFTTGSDYATGTDDNNPLPSEFGLSQNYPNPFNASTIIEFALPAADHVTLEVFNILGQKVATLADGDFTAGGHQVTWNSEGTPSGLYFYKLSTSRENQTLRMTLLK